jgi:NAD+ kinase
MSAKGAIPTTKGFDPQSVKCVGILAARHKRGIAETVRELAEWLSRRRMRTLLAPEQAEAFKLAELAASPEQFARQADLLISMGGDGTLLKAARLGAPHGVPILGINLGGFGFLAAIPRQGMLDSLSQIMAGHLRLQARMMLEAKVLREGTEVASFTALNDVVVGKGAFSRLFRLTTTVSGQRVSDLPADGMVVATPTGSTGYALSAGGPAVDPEARVIIVAPICPHTLSARSLVVPAERVVEIGLPDPRGEDVFLTADGQEGLSLHAGDRIQVREAPFSANLIVLSDDSFFAKLRGKLGWGSHR